MTVRLHAITFDTANPEPLARFWSAVLGRDLDPAHYPGMLSIGINEPERPFWLFMTSTGPADGRNRAHPDLASKDYDADLQRILGLGATITDEHAGEPIRYVTLADPDGNNFDLADE